MRGTVCLEKTDVALQLQLKKKNFSNIFILNKYLETDVNLQLQLKKIDSIEKFILNKYLNR